MARSKQPKEMSEPESKPVKRSAASDQAAKPKPSKEKKTIETADTPVALSKTKKAAPKAGKAGKDTKQDAKTSLDLHLYLFHESCDSRAYKFLGAHIETHGSKQGVTFRVWAPDAGGVSVLGNFNAWSKSSHPMEKISQGVWALFVPGLASLDAYKFAVHTVQGQWVEKSDPYAFYSEIRPLTASKVYDLSGYEWGDASWIIHKPDTAARPMNIYEIHLGSWRRRGDGGFLSYPEIADYLIPYAMDMGYTHIEFMPVTEHPLDDSWGYQVTGYFAATSRFGTPHDFMRLIDRCHQAGLGVIMDWVPAHFPKDSHGLLEFDGNCCYEYADPLKQEHLAWGTRVFDYGRHEVRSFLMSSALFWLEHFHIDGLRVDAVASMLYLDYGRKHGSWRPNIHGGHENLEAVDLLRKLNEAVYAQFPNTIMIAEESTAWPMVTQPTYMGGLGFTFKWNMGWMNDTLAYIKTDPGGRQYRHNHLTFTMTYAFSERFVLPLSHDEAVHLKGSLMNKMPGDYDEKFAGVRMYLSFMMAHPGKKLLFMGGEFGQFSEWNFRYSLDWHLLEFEKHRQLRHFVKTLNHFYLDNAALWENDLDWEGFTWLCCDDFQGSTLSFRRRGYTGTEVIALFNFSPFCRYGYRVGLPHPGLYHEVLNSDTPEFGGSGTVNRETMATQPLPWQEQPHSLQLTLPPFGAVFLRKAINTNLG